METLIIVLGVILGWRFELILFYISLDIIAKYILSVFKWKRILTVQKVQKNTKREEHIFLFLTTVFVFTGVYLLISLVKPQFFFGFEAENFRTVLNAGMKEFWILPFVGLAVYLSYKTDFIRGLEDRIVEAQGFFRRRCIEILAYTVTTTGLLYFNVENQNWILLILAGSKIGFEYPVLRLENKLMKQNLTKGY